MTSEELDQLERLAEAATPGPWMAVYTDDELRGLEQFGVNAPEEATGGCVFPLPAGTMVAGERTVASGCDADGEPIGEVLLPLKPHDAAFIAAARSAVPALITIVRKLRESQDKSS